MKDDVLLNNTNLNKKLANLNEVFAPLTRLNIQYNNALTSFAQQIQRNFNLTFAPALIELGKSVKKALEPFSKFIEFIQPYQKMGEVIFVYWKPLHNDFTEKIKHCDDINDVLEEFCTQNSFAHVEETIVSCRRHALLQGNIQLFLETIYCFRDKKFHIACLGLFALIDDILSIVSEQHTNVRIQERYEKILERLDNTSLSHSAEQNDLILLMTVRKAIEIISQKSDFTGDEPELLNRHWFMHGRSRKEVTQLDCIKLLNLLYGLLLLSDMAHRED